MPLTVNVDEKATNVATFTIEGSLDTSTYVLLEKKVDPALERNTAFIVFDMKGVDYISSAGVRVILKAKKAVKKRNGHVFLIHLQPKIKKVFEFINALPSMEAFPVEELDMYLHQMQEK